MEVTVTEFNRKLDVLRTISHPVRARILEELSKGIKCVSDFEEFLEISQPNVSQHMSLLRRMGVVDFYMEGRLRCYFLKDPLVLDFLEIVKTEYEEDLPAPACCPISNRA